MAIVASELIALVRAVGVAATQAQLAEVGAESDVAQARFTALAGIAGIVLAGAFVKLGQHLAQMAGNFQQSTEMLVTGAGEQQSALNGVRQGILQTAMDTGTATDQLNQAMFMIESGGFHAGAGLSVLKVAAEGAKLENSNLGQTAFALTGLLHDYGMAGSQAAVGMNELIETESSGKMHMQDLTTSLGRVLPLAASLHVAFPQVGGAIAVMTNANMTARNAANNLAFALRALSAPSNTAQAAMQSVGLSAQQVKNALSSGGLPAALQLIEQHVGATFPAGSVKSVEAMKAIMGGATGLNVALMLGGSHMKEYTANIAKITAAAHNGKAGVEGWALTQQEFNFRMDQFKEVMEATGIKIGMMLLPALSGLLSIVNPLATGFGNFIGWMAGHQETLAVVAGIFTALLVPAVVAFTPVLIAATAAAWGFAAAILANPITWIALAIGAAVAGIILAIQHWGQITAWVGGVFSELGTKVHGVLSAIGSFIGGVFSAIGSFIGGVFSGIGTKVHEALLGIATFFLNKWNDMLNFVRSIPGKIGQALSTLGALLLAPFKFFYDHNIYVKAAVDFIHQKLTDLKNFVGAVFSWIGTHIHEKLTDAKNFVGAVFSWIGTHIHEKLTDAKNFIGMIFSAIGAFIHQKLTDAKNFVGGIFSGMGTFVHDKLTDLKNTVGGAFSAMGTLMHDKLTDAWNGLKKFVSGWPTEAFQWGVNLITGFINGIKSMVGGIMSAAGGIAHNIAQFLGFHSPTPEGPGAESDRWAPNLVHMFASGLTAGLPDVQRAVNSLIKPVAVTMSTGGLPSGAFSTVHPLSGPYGQAPVYVEVYLDGSRMTKKIMPEIVRQIRVATGVRQ